jgi:hypothetical protein
MAATIADAVFDAALQYIEDNGTKVHIMSQASTIGSTDANDYTLGNETGCTYTGPGDAASGRKTSLDAISDGDVTGTDTATHFAITTTADISLVVQELASSQGVTSGNKFTLTAVEINIPDPTA